MRQAGSGQPHFYNYVGNIDEVDNEAGSAAEIYYLGGFLYK